MSSILHTRVLTSSPSAPKSEGAFLPAGTCVCLEDLRSLYGPPVPGKALARLWDSRRESGSLYGTCYHPER
jgi:hypothetical protein